MYNFFFQYIKKKLPKISPTELTALRSGNTSLDRSILEGTIEYPKPFKYSKKINDETLNKLFSHYDNSCIYPNNNNNKYIEYLAKNKFFSFLIDEKYGGIKLSVNEMSNILTKITSVDPSLGVVTMVPNSLGPGELISHYGTQEQKDHYLPKLADGTYIPCFGLTGPNNGSDATGNIDKGVVVKNGDKIQLKINLNKRYITLAPVANLMGIAFELLDPDNLLNKSGITLALVERNHEGLIQDTHHNPLNAGFPNGTIKGEILIDLDQVIGGQENIGNGWKMLMECLSAGRGVSLPATANASSKVATFGIYHYIKVRDQFKMPLENMEAIQEKFNNMVYNTWIIQSSIKLTNDILDNNNSPAVISAIMKQQTTERGRSVLNEALDIHGGAGICIGYSNFLEKFYRNVPIGITVEGSNTLTRTLMIFGQGLNKSHPHIFQVFNSILEDDKISFKENFQEIINHSIILYLKSFSISVSTLEQQIINFANLTNFVALKGGSIKREQMLSGNMADVFSNLYLALSVQYFQDNNDISTPLTCYIIKRLLQENQILINKIINNLGPEKYLLYHMKRKPSFTSYNEERIIFKEIMNNPKIIDSIKENIHIGDILHDLERINSLEKNSEEYIELKNKIINVGEYKNV